MSTPNTKTSSKLLAKFPNNSQAATPGNKPCALKKLHSKSLDEIHDNMLINFLKKRIITLEAQLSLKVPCTNYPPPLVPCAESQGAQTFNTTVQPHTNNMKSNRFFISATEKRALECYICHGSHHTLRCNVLAESKNKKDVLYKHRLCIICESHKWSANDPCSKSDHKCPACFKNHVLELCPSPAPLRSLPMKPNRNKRTNSDEKSISEDH